MKFALVISFIFFGIAATAQELYVFTEPASNMPAKAIGLYASERILRDIHSGKTAQRTTLGLQYGISKQWMVHGYTTFSDMYGLGYKWESVRGYAKYRFLSVDQIHKHFRAAAFGRFAYSSNRWVYDEVDLDGDQSGWQLGLVATQLLHKLAISASGSMNRILYFEKDKLLRPPVRNAFDYSLSAGYLLLPKEYKDYKQTNLNIYCELLGQKDFNSNKYYVDIAPAIQLIFNSTTKVNFGARFELAGNMHRMAEPYRTYMLSIEHTILNAVK